MSEPSSPRPSLAEGVRALLGQFEADPQSSRPVEVQQAIYVARALQERASLLQTPQERRQQAEFDRMIQNPHDKTSLVQLTDQAFRSSVPHRAADQLIHILDVQGVPRFFGSVERTLLKGFQSFGSYLPGVAVPLVKEKMHRETANVILPAEPEMLTAHLEQRREEGVRMNVNHLGEAILGEGEAQRRLEGYLETLQLPQIEVISVKISTIYSQISALAREHTLRILCDRLELLYRAAGKMEFERSDGSRAPKFVYLDMEEYRDMLLTAEAFMRTLDRPGLEECTAGIVLQAYIPDSFRTQQQINAWARRRVASGGAPITLRIVKGANLEMERLEASLAGWPQAPFKTKRGTDSNYKRMVNEGVRPENLAAVRLGIASHNLFEMAYGLVLAARHDALDRIQFEMLEGMANHQRRALFELTRNVLLYAPACHRDNFIHAIGYLIRRLDENTGPENFLRHAFKLDVGSPDWNELEEAFLESFDRIETLSDGPRRTQDRHQPPAAPVQPAPVEPVPAEPEQGKITWQPFTNEPNTDFALPQNDLWAEELIADWQDRADARATEIPLVIDGERLSEGRRERECRDPSRPETVVGRYRQATLTDVDRAVASARADADGWRRRTPAERSAILADVAQELRAARGDLMGAALADGGKTLAESDPEVSEAVDFVEFYRHAAESFAELPGLAARGKGVVVVVSPWNFPIAIPCGGVAAALAAGNTVILKPASDAVLVAHQLCHCFWRGGVPQRALQLVPCSGAEGGARLVAHDEVDTVILTGGTSTALSMLAAKPAMDLLAETGGKNATIVTAMSDRDQAIKHVLHSAFSHSGQKCSATSLLILEQEVYEDRGFRDTLCDAVESIRVGSAWELDTKMGPLIRPPSGELETALKELEPGESWAVMPHRVGKNRHLTTPGVKWGVAPGSFTHMTEFFGPLLGVMQARNLPEAIGLVNQTGYGLTSGLESLDDREQELWLEGIRAGNLYLNRPTTGAIVLRQPFGGMGKSAFGPGIKAGGPNYVAQLLDFRTVESGSSQEAPADETLTVPSLERLRRQLRELAAERGDLPADQLEQTAAALASYDRAAGQEFAPQHDHFRLIGQDNIRRYLPVRELRVRVHPDDTLFDLFARVGAARTAGCRITVSAPPDHTSAALDLLHDLTEPWAAAVEFVEETDEELARVITEQLTDRIRYAHPDRVPEIVRRAVADTGLFIAARAVLAEGRVELLWYVEEQSLSIDYHRYGNLGLRAAEERAETL